MQALLGAIVVALTVVSLVFRNRGGRASSCRTPPTTRTARRGIMFVLTVAAAAFVLPALFSPLRRGFFAFCETCPIVGLPATSTGLTERAGLFLLAVWEYAATVLPVFVLACALSGLIIVQGERIRIGGFFGSFLLGSALPLCSCGVLPISKSLMDRGGAGIRDGLVLLIAAPLMSPVVVLLGLATLGAYYVVVRAVATLAMAAVAVWIVLPLLPRGGDSGSDPAARSAPGIPTGRPERPERALDAGWRTLTGLLPYVLFGVVLGALVAASVPVGAIARILGSGPLATAALVVLGTPMSMCAGEEVLVVAPLVDAGLTMGQAIAFALAAAGICVGSIPLLMTILGRKAALAVLGLYLVVPFIIGVALNLVPWLHLGAGQPLSP